MQFLQPLMYPAALDANMKEQVRERLHAHRVTSLDYVLQVLQRPGTIERLGDHTLEFQAFITELLGLASKSPERFSQLFGNWGCHFMLVRTVSTETTDLAHVRRMLSNLNLMLVQQRLAGGADLDDAAYTTLADGYGMLRGERVALPGRAASGKRVVWRFSGSTLALHEEGVAEPFATVPLPTTRVLETTPLPMARGWNVPVLEDIELLGVSGSPVKTREDSQDTPDPDWTPKPIRESVEVAYKLIKELWPEVIDWAEVLLPSFVDMGGVPSRAVHRSASYGAGTPVFLTKVDDPMDHAEDIVHEMQHERLYLTLDTDAFGLWNDGRQRFVSPYRSDPRPLRGLHLGLHAFVAVNRLRLDMAHRYGISDEKRYQLIKSHRMNLFSFRTLIDHEQIAPHGAILMAGMARELAAQHKPIQELSSPGMGDAFDKRLAEHIENVARLSSDIVNGHSKYIDWDETAEIADRYAKSTGVRA